jgi:hypothetical protein
MKYQPNGIKRSASSANKTESVVQVRYVVLGA